MTAAADVCPAGGLAKVRRGPGLAAAIVIAIHSAGSDDPPRTADKETAQPWTLQAELEMIKIRLNRFAIADPILLGTAVVMMATARYV